MYKVLDEKFIIRTLKEYEGRTKELRKEMSGQYDLLRLQDDDVMQAVAYPQNDSTEPFAPKHGRSIDSIYEKYCELAVQRTEDIKILMRDITEEQETMNRIMAAYGTLDAMERHVMEQLYVNNISGEKIYEAAQRLAQEHDLHLQTIYRIRRRAIAKIIEIYNSDMTQAEIYKCRAQAVPADKEKYR